MKHKFFSLIFILLFLYSQTLTAFATEPIDSSAQTPDTTPSTDPPSISAVSAVLMDATTGTILYEKDCHSQQYPASITKLMTILLALEHGNLEDTITFSHDAVYSIEPGSSHIAIQEGETLTLEQVLYGIILRSANECANAVAEYVDGSMEAFAKHMTERAKELGCEHTNFVNAHGLFDENHYTTAYDMALISRELLQNDTYRSIMSDTYYVIPPTNKQTEERPLHGQHQMLNESSLYYYEYAEGGKTGYTVEAQNTLVTYAKQGDTELIAVVLKCSGAQHYVDTKALFEYGFEHFQTVKAFSPADLAQRITVTETYQNKTTTKDTISIAPAQDIYVTIPTDAQISDITTDIQCPQSTSAPVAVGEVLGTVTLSLHSDTLATVDLTAQQQVSTTTDAEREAQAAQTRNQIFKTVGIIIGILILLFLTVFCVCRYISYRHRQQRRLQRKNRRKRRLQQHTAHHIPPHRKQ